jgi:hypothetical protein
MTARAQAEAALQRHYGFPPTEADWQDEDGRPGIGRAVEDAIAAAVRDAERAALERCIDTVRAFFKGASSQDDPTFLDPVRQQLSDALVAAIRAMAPAAGGTWSKEPPTVPGYWWWRLSESHEPEIVSLLKYGDRLLIGHVFGADASKTEGEWAGPLIPPPAPRPRPESAP